MTDTTITIAGAALLPIPASVKKAAEALIARKANGTAETAHCKLTEKTRCDIHRGTDGDLYMGLHTDYSHLTVLSAPDARAFASALIAFADAVEAA